MLLEAERWEMYSTSKHLRLGQDTDTSYAIKFHLHIWIAVRITQVRQMRAPCRVLGVSLHDHCVFVERVREREGSLRFLPRVEVVGLFAAQPVREGPPHIYHTHVG